MEISIEITNDCLLKCLHCSSSSIHPPTSEEMNFNSIIKILEDASKLGFDTCSLSGGEPLLYSSIDKLLNDISEMGYKILLYTSGIINENNNITSISKDRLKYLNSFVNDITLIFSVYSNKQEVHDYITSVNNSFILTLESIDNAVALGIPCESHFVAMKPNYMDINDTYSMIKKIGVGKMSILRFIPHGRGKENSDSLEMSKEEFINLQKIMLKMESDNIRIGHPIDFRFTMSDKFKPAKCRAGMYAPIITTNGNVYVCPAWKSLPYTIGNIFDDELKNIWTTNDNINIIRDFLTKPDTDNIKCATCTYINECALGCTAYRMLKNKCDKGLKNHIRTGCDDKCPLI